MKDLQLVIHLSRTSVHVAEVLRSTSKIIWQKDFELLESNARGYKDQLKNIFEEINLQTDYEEYSMAWATPNQTLVPLSVYNESSTVAIYQLLFGEAEDKKTLDFNRLMELSMVSVYEIPDWVKSFFVMRFPTLLFKHEHAMTLRALFQMKTFQRKTNITVCKDYIDISIIEHNELIFSNSFEYQEPEDIVYHLLFVLDQKKATSSKKEELQFLFVDEKTEKLAEKTIQLLEKSKAKLSLQTKEISSVLKLQTLCV